MSAEAYRASHNSACLESHYSPRTHRYQAPSYPTLPQILQDTNGDDPLISWAQGLRFSSWCRNINIPLEAQTAAQQFISVVKPNMSPFDKRHLCEETIPRENL